MGYLHFEVTARQRNKGHGLVCGDVWSERRTPFATTVICADGIGSGTKAHIAATLCVSRLDNLLNSQMSLREAFIRVVRTMNQWRSPQEPYTAFSVARALNDGRCTILSYDAPGATLLKGREWSIIPRRELYVEQVQVFESVCHLSPGDGLLLVSDGITQAGLGCGLKQGWEESGVRQFSMNWVRTGHKMTGLPDAIMEETDRIANYDVRDDRTVLLLRCRRGTVVNIMTGPPGQPGHDKKVVEQFLRQGGLTVVCGATTAKIVAQYLNQKLTIPANEDSMVAPPRYEINGIDLVTEGAVTLNQLYHILDADPSDLREINGVTELFYLVQAADRINLTVGLSANPANHDISFRQRGLIPRDQIIRLLIEKFKKMGKMVYVKYE